MADAPAAQSAGASHYIFGLDVVRATAILLVIVSHLLPPIEFLGVAGVELFFVLSGYLVGGIFLRAILREQGSYPRLLLNFWKRRWARTLPNYFLFIVVFFVEFHPPDGRTVLQYSFFLQNLWYPIGDFFQVSWSLAVEEWFYLLVPGVTTLLLIFTRRPLRSICVTAGILMLGSFVIRLFPSVTDFNRQMRMLVIYRLDSLAIGVVGAIVAHQAPGVLKQWARAWPVAVALLLFLSFVLFAAESHLNNFRATLLFSLLPISALVMLSRMIDLRDPGGLLGRAARNISHWSYSMYLCHMPIFFLLYRLPGYANYPSYEKLAVRLVGVVVILVVSATIYRFFEQPMLARLSPRQAPH